MDSPKKLVSIHQKRGVLESRGTVHTSPIDVPLISSTPFVPHWAFVRKRVSSGDPNFKYVGPEVIFVHNAPKIVSTTNFVRFAYWALRAKMRAFFPMLELAAITEESFWDSALAEPARQSSQAPAGEAPQWHPV